MSGVYDSVAEIAFCSLLINGIRSERALTLTYSLLTAVFVNTIASRSVIS